MTHVPPGHCSSQLPPGHSDATVQTAPLLAPPTHLNAPVQARNALQPPRHVIVGEHVLSLQSFGFVACPGTLQPPPGHSLIRTHGVPALAPPRQRLPPHTLAPTATQSAFDVHGVAAVLLQVSQKHLSPVKPGARQLGFAADKVTD